MLKFENVKFDYDPYPIGIAKGAFAPEVYRELVDTLPEDKVFLSKDYLGVKLSLSQLNNRAGYYAHLRSNPAWQRFYDYIKSERFIAETLVQQGYRLKMLREEEVNLEDVFMGITKGITN